VWVYDDDVFDTFSRYFCCHPTNTEAFLLNVIENPWDCWYAAIPMGLKPVRDLVKQIFLDNGLDPAEYTNKWLGYLNNPHG
jgi:hypothetical protein